MKKLSLGMLDVLVTCGMAMGYGFELPAVTNASPGSTVVIPLTASGESDHQGGNITVEVTSPLEIDGLGVDAGTIWEGNNTGAFVMVMGNVANTSVTTMSGTVATPGVVAFVLINVPAGTPNGDYLLRTYSPTLGTPLTLSWLGGWGPPPEIWIDPLPPGQTQGIIRVPEPMTALLLTAAVAFLRRPHR